MPAKEFNQKQTDFVSSMGNRFKDNSWGLSMEQIGVLVGIALFFALVGFIYFIYLNRGFIRRKLTYMGRILNGQAVAKDRRSRVFEVAVRQPGDALGRVYHGSTLNLSPRGMFLKLNPPLNKGDSFHFLIDSPKGRIAGMAEVMWVQPGWSEHHSTGMGCKFVYTSPEDQAVVMKVLSER